MPIESKTPQTQRKKLRQEKDKRKNGWDTIFFKDYEDFLRSSQIEMHGIMF